jgi:hypothetical protein
MGCLPTVQLLPIVHNKRCIVVSRTYPLQALVEVLDREVLILEAVLLVHPPELLKDFGVAWIAYRNTRFSPCRFSDGKGDGVLH